MSEASISIWPDLGRARISPLIYGHFAEHLGRCIYEGVWVGKDARVPNENGVRLDVLAALKQLRAPVIRWPGGCFADDYHWRAGIGPAARRPKTANLWWRQGEPNSFGTDEFMAFCRALDCAAYICCNVGSGSPREARDWLEYCNFGGESALARLRAENGAPEPYDVRYWGVGNESWGCGGRFLAADYAHEYARFANYLKAMDPGIELIACGASSVDGRNPRMTAWNHDFCAAMPHPDLIDHLSIHRYFKRGRGKDFSEHEHQALFADLYTMERDLESTEAVLRYFYPHKFIGIIIDEWGVWHPEAVVDNGLEQPNTLRDAVFAGAALNLFNRWAHRITMANLAQTINVLQCLAVTGGPRMFLTPNYHVYDMMRGHAGAQLLTQALDVPSFEAHPVGCPEKQAIPALDCSASRAGKKVLATIANQTASRDIETRIVLREVQIQSVSARILHSGAASDENSFKEPKRVAPKRLKVEHDTDAITLNLPAHSFVALSIAIE